VHQICTLIQDPHYSIMRICTVSIPLPISAITKTSTQMSKITRTSTQIFPILENPSRLWHLITVRIPWAFILYKAINIVIGWDKFHTQLRYIYSWSYYKLLFQCHPLEVTFSLFHQPHRSLTTMKPRSTETYIDLIQL
jgi:hypothetical protein